MTWPEFYPCRGERQREEGDPTPHLPGILVEKVCVVWLQPMKSKTRDLARTGVLPSRYLHRDGRPEHPASGRGCSAANHYQFYVLIYSNVFTKISHSKQPASPNGLIKTLHLPSVLLDRNLLPGPVLLPISVQYFSSVIYPFFLAEKLRYRLVKA